MQYTSESALSNFSRQPTSATMTRRIGSRRYKRIAELEAALAAERERREAAELILRGVINYTPHITQVEDAAADHFARYEKDGEG